MGEFRKIIWVTYTKGFEPLENRLSSDAGWGCMVRTGQMLFCTWLQLHLGAGFDSRWAMQLLRDSDGPFGIHRIMQSAKEQFGMLPGEWFSPSQIIYCLQELAGAAALKELEGLQIAVLNSGVLIFEDLLRAAGVEALCPCVEEQAGLVFCGKHMAWRQSVAVIVLCRLGLDRPQEKYLEVLELMFEVPQFTGVIGGRPRNALYMVGKNQRKIIYLDPHYVRSAISAESIAAREQFGCPSIRELASSGIDCSLGLTFYVRSGEELNSLYAHVAKIKASHEDGMFVFVEKRTPSFMRDDADKQLKAESMD